MDLNVEFVEHEVLGYQIVFALDEDNRDWYFETVRKKKPFVNPVHHHLPALRQALGAEGFRYADFGANIGTTALFAAALGVPTLAIEAGSVNFALLMEAQRANNFGSLLRPIYIAASDRIGVATFAENSAWGALTESVKQTTRIPTVPMAQILETHDFRNISLIKVDIEGAEMQALAGFETLIKDRGSAHVAPDLIVESNEVACRRFGYTPQALWARLKDLGYTVYLLGPGRVLTKLDADTLQTAIVEDVLATQHTEAFLEARLNYKVQQYDAPAALAKLEAMVAAPDDTRHREFAQRQLDRIGIRQAS